MDHVIDHWKWIPGFPGYQINVLGTVRSFKVKSGRRNSVISKEPQRIIASSKSKNPGYKIITLYLDGKPYTFSLSHLVLITFVGPRGDGQVARHLDGNPGNNSLDNIRWGTPKDVQADVVMRNNDHKTKGTFKGERHGGSKLSSNQVKEIRRRFVGGHKQTDLANAFGVTKGNINLIVRGKSWSHLPNTTPLSADYRKMRELPGEVWQSVPGFPFYKVSNLGRVASLRVWGSDSAYSKTGRILIQRTTSTSRKRVSLTRNKKAHSFFVHRLVLMAFIGPCPPKKEARHLNGNPSDNRLENLQWSTHKKNMADQLTHGTRIRGDSSTTAKVSTLDVIKIRELSANKVSYPRLGKMFGLSPSSIAKIVRHESWKHIK